MTASPDDTGQKQDTRFQPGQSGNPAGRPRGARNKFSDTFLQALADDFESHGADVIRQVREERPHDYLKVCASLMPKRLENENIGQKSVREMTNAELEAIIWKSAEEMGGIEAADIEAAEVRIAAGTAAIQQKSKH